MKVFLSTPNFHPQRCNVSPLRIKQRPSWPMSKRNAGVCARHMLPVINSERGCDADSETRVMLAWSECQKLPDTDTESAFIKGCSGTVIASDSIVYIDMTIIMVVIIIVIMTPDCKIIKFKFLTWYTWRCVRRFAKVWFGSLPRTSVSYLLSFFVLLSFVDVLQLLNYCTRGVGTASKVSNCCPTYSWNYTLSRGPPRPETASRMGALKWCIRMHHNTPCWGFKILIFLGGGAQPSLDPVLWGVGFTPSLYPTPSLFNFKLFPTPLHCTVKRRYERMNGCGA